MTLFECDNLTLGYAGTAVAENLSFYVEKGDYLCIIGENGSGKSTLIKTLLGLAKPLSGKIHRSDEFSPERIGYMPQQTKMQRDFPASVKEIVMSAFLGGKGFFGFYSKKDLERARFVMKRLEIDGLERRSCRELSGGQQQRVLLARALCAAKDVLLVDEPCAGLDSGSTAELYSIIDELNKKDGMTVIMVTHDIEAAQKYATKILHLGKKRFFCTDKNQMFAFDESGSLKNEDGSFRKNENNGSDRESGGENKK